MTTVLCCFSKDQAVVFLQYAESNYIFKKKDGDKTTMMMVMMVMMVMMMKMMMMMMVMMVIMMMVMMMMMMTMHTKS